MQARAVTGTGEGPWSSAGSVTPLGPTLEPTDFNGDGGTDFADFFLFADAYGTTNPGISTNDIGNCRNNYPNSPACP